jgi:hypothetical protein
MRWASMLQLPGRTDEARRVHALLRGVPLFRDLPVADLVALGRCLTTVEAPAGTVLCRRGEPGDRCYVVRSGRLEVRLGVGPSGIFVRSLEPGALFGEMALITGQPRSADVVAVEDAVLWALDRADFVERAARSVPLLQALNRDLCIRLAIVTLQLEELAMRIPDGAGADAPGLRFGPYRVVAPLAAGGQGAVFSAVHDGTGTAAAVKVVPAAWGAAPELRERLAREAAVLQHVRHPNVIHVYEVGEVAGPFGGGCYIAMEVLPHALDRVLRAQHPDPLPAATALRLARGVAEGLAAVHALGIVHRDVKPSNVLLRADGTPVLTDFGLVTALAEARVALGQRLTESDVVPGTADYMAPEQVTGQALDGRCDLYALGVMLYEMLAGHSPFAGLEPYETLRAHLETPPPPLPDRVPPAARAIVDRALQKGPDERYASAEAMAQALAAAETAPDANGPDPAA